MPAGELRIIRRRIRSVQSTMKITRAMELIAASRILKAEQRVAASRPYALRMAAVMANLQRAAGGAVRHPLLDERGEVERSAVLVLCADRGLCGAYNTAVLKLAQVTVEALPGSSKSVVSVGRKAQSYFKYRGIPIARSWQGISDQPTYSDAKEVADYCIEQYVAGELDRIDLVYTTFKSAVTQEPRVVRLLPIDTGELSAVDEKRGRAAGAAGAADATAADTIFEPSATEILGDLLPKGVQSRVYSALLDSAASEHAARRRAMKAATDNARDLIRSLQIRANKARQAAITTEILEVVGGAEALAQKAE